MGSLGRGLRFLEKRKEEDVQGVKRGKCQMCKECPQFLSVSDSIVCNYCGCFPTKHENKGTSNIGRTISGTPSSVLTSSNQTWRLKHHVTSPPRRLAYLLSKPPVSREKAIQHSWNREDKSPNIDIRDDDPLTFHRSPAYMTTDAIRGRGIVVPPNVENGNEEAGGMQGYDSGMHVWKIDWPKDSRGTHPVVGVATRDCPLTEPGYKRLVGSNKDSWGWCIGSLKLYHDSERYRKGKTYPLDIHKDLKPPDTFLMILDCDRGTLAFQVDDDYLGAAFCGLEGELFPIVSAVWGHCEVTLTYINKHEFEDDEG